MQSKILQLLFLFVGCVSFSQENISYQMPPKEILDLADYERAPSISMDKDRNYILFSYRNTYKNLEDLNQDEMKLGGLRINPVTNISSTVTYINNLKIRKFSDKNLTQISGLPKNARITNISWSPNYKKISFTHTTSKGVELWVIDVATATAKKLTEDNINANIGNPTSWFKDSEHILVRTLPSNKPDLIDTLKDIPTGPTVSTSDGSKSQNRTYQDLLKNKTDEANFESLITSELYKVSLNGTKTLFKEAAMYAGW